MEGNQRLKNRVSLNVKGFLALLKILDPKNEYGLKLNMHLLKLATDEYFKYSDDLKKQHNIKYTNGSKRVSLTMNFIMKNKPIVICQKKDRLPMKILLANEIYAFVMGVSHLPYTKCFKDKEATLNFLYLLHNKCIDSEAFAIVINIFDRILKACKEIENASKK